MTTREKTSALGATFLFVLAFRPGYSEPASPANAPDHREHTASATYDGTPSSHPPFIEALNAGVDAYTPAGPNRIPLPCAATGNIRDKTHTVSAPREGSDGWLELTTGAACGFSEFHLLNVRAGQRLALYIGGNTWEVPHTLEAELLTRRGQKLILVSGIERIRPDGFGGAGWAQKAPRALVFTGVPEQDARIALRIRTTGLRPEERPRLNNAAAG